MLIYMYDIVFFLPHAILYIYKPFLAASDARHEVLEMTHKFMPGSQSWTKNPWEIGDSKCPQKISYGTMDGSWSLRNNPFRVLVKRDEQLGSLVWKEVLASVLCFD